MMRTTSKDFVCKKTVFDEKPSYNPRCTRVQLNISGTRYETYLETLERFPTTLLGDMSKRCNHFSRGEYYFDRNRTVFDSILFFYQSYGRLMRPSDVPMSIFESECKYFQLPDDVIASMKEREGYLLYLKEELLTPAKTFRKKVWYVLKYPHSSRTAFVFNVFSLIVSVLSVVLPVVESMLIVEETSTENQQFLFLFDIMVTVYFVLEITIYLLVSPFWRTATSPMTYIDLISSYPYLISALSCGKSCTDFPLTLLKSCRVLRVVKMFRLFKLFISSKRAEVMSRVLVSSLQELFLLFLCLLIIIFLGASFIYMIESRVPGSQFSSIPACSWWALQTVVVLGYGDLVPTTEEGKLLAAVFMICGATTIALPVLSVATKFLNIYKANS